MVCALARILVRVAKNVGHSSFLLVICLSLPPVSHPMELLPNPGTTDFSPTFHNVRARVATRVLCGAHLYLIPSVVYSACDGRGSCLPESVVVCTNQSGSRDVRALDPPPQVSNMHGEHGIECF